MIHQSLRIPRLLSTAYYLLFLSLFTSASLSACMFIAQPSYAQWAATYGGGGGGDEPSSIQQTSDGGYIVAGATNSFSAGGNGDFWVLKLTADGSILWQKTYGGSPPDGASSIQQTSDGGYIVAGMTISFGAGLGDFWVLKLDAGGDVQWQKTYGGGRDDGIFSPSRIQQTNDGGYILAGMTNSFGAGNSDFWVLKLAADGSILWQKTYGGSSLDRASSIQQTSDGGYIVTGNTFSFGAGSDDFWVLKLDFVGNVLWQKAYGGSSIDVASSIQQTSDGGYIVAGYTFSFGAGLGDFWVLKLDAGGNVLWQKTYGGGNNDGTFSPSPIQQTSDGGYIVAGGTFSFGAGFDDSWVLKLAADGSVLWQKTYGGSFHDRAFSIQQTSDGGYIVAGETDSFGVSSEDFWVLKLKPDGTIDPSCSFIADTSVSGIDSSATVTNTFAIVSSSSAIPQTSLATVQNTSVSPDILCEAAVEVDCSNGIDDDGDGLIDCADPDCIGDPACLGGVCTDGIDNDGDGLVDCDDPICCDDPTCFGSSACTILSETLLNQEGVLNDVAVSGVDAGGNVFTSTLNFTFFELVRITTGSFAGKGFSTGVCEITLDGIPYTGEWRGAISLRPQEGRIYLRGAISGGITATVEGYLTESIQGSDFYDKYQATWQIGRLGSSAVSILINLNGDITYLNISDFPGTELLLLQDSIETTELGHYGGALSAVLTHLRVVSPGHLYVGQGFSIISYTHEFGSGQGWTYDRLISPGIVQLKGLFSSPLFGIVSATLDGSTLPRTLSLSIERVDLVLPPMADLEVTTWGPVRVSPGETVNYAVEYRNDGTISAENVVIVCELPSLAQYISSTSEGIYRWETHEAIWKLGTVPPKQKGLLSVKVSFRLLGLHEGIPQGTLAMYGSSSTDKDFFLNPGREPLFDLQEYLDYQPLEITTENILTPEEFDAELAFDSRLNDLYQCAINLGYSDHLAIKKTLNNGSTLIEALMSNTSDEELFLTNINDTYVLGQYTETSISILDCEGGMTWNLDNNSLEFFGNWGEGDCVLNCAIRDFNISLLKKHIGELRKALDDDVCKKCFNEEAGFSLYCTSCANATHAIPEINIALGKIHEACKEGIPCPPCNEDKVWCFGNKAFKFECINGSYNPIPEEINCMDDLVPCTIWPPPLHKICLSGKCVDPGDVKEGCGSNSLCNSHFSVICTPHDPNEKTIREKGAVAAGQELHYTVEFENTGSGKAFGVYFTDVLDENLNAPTLRIGPVKDVRTDLIIGPDGRYDPLTRTITWVVGGDLGGVEENGGGYAEFSVEIKSTALPGTKIINRGSVTFPSAPTPETPIGPIESLIPMIEDCDNGVDDDDDGLIDCTDEGDCPPCSGPPPPSLCSCSADSLGSCISGRVTDRNGNPLSRKKVKLKRGKRTIDRARTNSDGCYNFTNVADGTYKVKVKCKGKRPRKQPVTITNGGNQNGVNFTCKK